MISKSILTLALAATLALAPVNRLAAGANDLVGGIVGGIIGGVIVNEANKNRPRTTTRRVHNPAATSATRAANRETQTALNYFGFPAGAPDGIVGRRTRAAVSGMQAFLNMPVTGQLTQFERDILIGAYTRGITGSYDALQLVAKDPRGTKALLAAQRDMMMGTTTTTRIAGYAGLPIEVSEAVDEVADSSDPSAEQLLQRSGFIQIADLNGDGNNDYILDTSFSGSSFWCSSVQCKALVFVSTAQGYARNDLLAFDPTPASFECIGGGCRVKEPDASVLTATETAPAPEAPVTTLTTGLSTLPLLAAPATTASLSSHCSKVSLLTNANGGFTNVADMTDPDLVLNEQFCLARAYAMDSGERLVAGLQGVTQAQVDAQCAAYGPTLKDYVASLSLKPRDEVIRDVGGFVLSGGLDPAQLALTAKVCLSVGYRQDDMDIALGSALLMVVLGEAPYGELMGHHLSQGFGTSQRKDLSLEWYDQALAAIDDGAAPVFAPNQLDRVDLIDAAVRQLSGADQAKISPAKSKTPSGLPTFKAAE